MYEHHLYQSTGAGAVQNNTMSNMNVGKHYEVACNLSQTLLILFCLRTEID